MKGDAATFNFSGNASGWKRLRSSVNFSFLSGNLRPLVRAALILLGCLLLLPLLALQIVALEISDRFDIFSLYGFFTLNFVYILFLSGFYFVSRRLSARFNQNAANAEQSSRNRFGRFWARLRGSLKVRESNTQKTPAKKSVAVLLIIKREASEEKSALKSRVVSA